MAWEGIFSGQTGIDRLPPRIPPRVRAAGGFVTHAHPYREAYIPGFYALTGSRRRRGLQRRERRPRLEQKGAPHGSPEGRA
jgi:hypothetical protein